jgi:hypothetical protein
MGRTLEAAKHSVIDTPKSLLKVNKERQGKHTLPFFILSLPESKCPFGTTILASTY